MLVGSGNAAVVGFEDDRALEPAVVGAKAARLGAARRAGLRVADGYVLETALSLPAISRASRVADERGSAGARLTMMHERVAGDVLATARARLARGPLIVRSSSPLEAAATWSGAFSSYLGVQPNELETAILGCWASVFSRDATARFEVNGERPAASGMAVLVQLALEVSLGGIATVRGDSTEITVADGDLPALLQGWQRGLVCEVPARGRPNGPAVEHHGSDSMRAVARLARRCHEQLGDDLIEWAIANGQCYLLQCRRLERPSPAKSRRHPSDLRHREAARIARTIARFGGRTGDELALPWCLAPGGMPSAAVAPSSTASVTNDEPFGLRAGALTAQAWGREVEAARAEAAIVLWRLREGLDPEALSRLARLDTIDWTTGNELVALAEAAATSLIVRRELFDPDDAWRLAPDAFASLLEHASAVPGGGSRREDDELERATVPDVSPWMPFLCEAVLQNGAIAHGNAAGSGIGAGRLLVLDRPMRLHGCQERRVLHVQAPTPGFAPLLWGAAGIVSATGSASAHLFDVARSLGVPAVAGVDLADVLDCPGAAVVAVDGETGVVAAL